MRKDIDTELVFWSEEAENIYHMLYKFLRNEYNANFEDLNFSGLDDFWEDNVEGLVRVVMVDTWKNSILQTLSEHMKQAIRSSSERYSGKCCNGIDKYRDDHNARLVSLAQSVVPDVNTNYSSLRLLQTISGIVGNVTHINMLPEYEFDLSIEMFGSSLSQLCTDRSDLDLVLRGTYSSKYTSGLWAIDSMSRENAVHVLKSLNGHLCRKGGFNIEFVPAPTYPMLKIYDRKTNLSCDLCFNIGGGIDPRKDQVLLALNMVDERFRLLFTLVKLWADEHNLVGASLGRLNSYTLAQLVIFHLQNRPVPILPKFRAILPGEKFGSFETGCRFTHPNESVAAVSAAHRLRCFANKHLLSFGIDDYGNTTKWYRNEETISDLFNSFMILMVGLFEGWNPDSDSMGTLLYGTSEPIPTSNLMRYLRISTYYGCLYFGESPVDEINRVVRHPKHYNDPGVIFVEDPFDKAQNTAKALSRKCSKSIVHAARSALNSFQYDYLDEYILKVFGYEI